MSIMDDLNESRKEPPTVNPKVKMTKGASELSAYEDLLKANDEALKDAGYFTVSESDRKKAEEAAASDAGLSVSIEERLASIKAPLDLLREVSQKTEQLTPEQNAEIQERQNKYIKESNGISLENPNAGKWRLYEEPYDIVYPDADNLMDYPTRSDGSEVKYYNSCYTVFSSNKAAFESERDYACREFDKELKARFTNDERNRLKKMVEASPDREPTEKWLDYIHNNYVEIAVYKDNHPVNPDLGGPNFETRDDLYYSFHSDFDQVESTLRKIYKLPN